MQVSVHLVPLADMEGTVTPPVLKCAEIPSVTMITVIVLMGAKKDFGEARVRKRARKTVAKGYVTRRTGLVLMDVTETLQETCVVVQVIVNVSRMKHANNAAKIPALCATAGAANFAQAAFA